MCLTINQHFLNQRSRPKVLGRQCLYNIDLAMVMIFQIFGNDRCTILTPVLSKKELVQYGNTLKQKSPVTSIYHNIGYLKCLNIIQ